MAKQGYKIIDCDIHVVEPRDLWEKYIDPKFRDRAPTIAPIGDTGRSSWQCEGKFFPAYTDHPLRAALNKARYDQTDARFTRYDAARERGYDPQSQLDAMDDEGIDVGIAFRTMGSHVIAMDGMDGDFAAALCRAFNRWLAERSAYNPERLKASAVVPVQDIRLAVQEAEYAVGELGHIAIVLPSHRVEGRNWYDPYYDPLWQAACDLGVPVAFHSMQGAYQEHIGNRFLDNLTMMHATGHALEHMMAMGSLITGGTFDRYPKLKAAFLEGTCGWTPWWLWRLDDDYEKIGSIADRVKLQDMPSGYFRRHCYVALEPGEALVTKFIESLGNDNLVISSDWPHDDSSYPHAMDIFLGLEGLSDESRRKILWDNSAALYGVS